MVAMRQSLRELANDALLLQLALQRKTQPHILALLLPQYWSAFIRSGPIEDVKPLGTVEQSESESGSIPRFAPPLRTAAARCRDLLAYYPCFMKRSAE